MPEAGSFFVFWLFFYGKKKYLDKVRRYLAEPKSNPLPGWIITDNIQPFVQYFLLVLNQVSNKNTQQPFFVSLLADWKGLSYSGLQLLNKVSGVGLQAQTYTYKKKIMAEKVKKLTEETCKSRANVCWFDNFNVSWRNKSTQHSTQSTNVTNWTVFGTQFLPNLKSTLKLQVKNDGEILSAVPFYLPEDSQSLITTFALSYKQVSYSTCFVTKHNVYNFPYDLSLKRTPTVDKKKIHLYKEAGKLTNYLSLDLQPFNSASNRGLQKDMLQVRKFIQTTSLDHYQPYIFDQNIYPRVVKVIFLVISNFHFSSSSFLLCYFLNYFIYYTLFKLNNVVLTLYFYSLVPFEQELFG